VLGRRETGEGGNAAAVGSNAAMELAPSASAASHPLTERLEGERLSWWLRREGERLRLEGERLSS